MSCPLVAPPQQGVLPGPSTSRQRQQVCPRVRHIVSGTFNSDSLHLLSFDTLTRTLSLLSTVPGYGPHSLLTPGRTAGSSSSPSSSQDSLRADLLYATTWAENRPELCAWRIDWHQGDIRALEWLGNVPIAATSSYVHVQPPPYSALTAPSFGLSPGPSRFLYSAGGPTGEVHAIDSATGALKKKVQELVFVKGGAAAFSQADKTRKALRYGAHNVDIGRGNLAYIADLGREAILVFRHDPDSGLLTLLSEAPMPGGGHDGPRHVVPSACGRFVYSVTEHTSFVDVWRVRRGGDEGATLEHLHRVSVLPAKLEAAAHNYRGDTVRLSPDGSHLFATTRGMRKDVQGYVAVWRLDPANDAARALTDDAEMNLHRVVTYQTRNSGGKANAIEFAPRYGGNASGGSSVSLDYAILTDDQEGYISVLEWDGADLRDVSTVQLPALESGELQGASQAVWVS